MRLSHYNESNLLFVRDLNVVTYSDCINGLPDHCSPLGINCKARWHACQWQSATGMAAPMHGGRRGAPGEGPRISPACESAIFPISGQAKKYAWVRNDCAHGEEQGMAGYGMEWQSAGSQFRSCPMKMNGRSSDCTRDVLRTRTLYA